MQRERPTDLDLGRGLTLRCAAEHVWLIFPPPHGTRAGAANLTITARNTPTLRAALIAWLEREVPEQSAAARRYLQEFNRA